MMLAIFALVIAGMRINPMAATVAGDQCHQVPDRRRSCRA
jgi:hypothetical protein